MTSSASTESSTPEITAQKDHDGDRSILVAITCGVVLFLMTPILGIILSQFATSLPDLLTSEVSPETGYVSNNAVFSLSTNMAILGMILLSGGLFYPLVASGKLSEVKVIIVAALTAIPLAFLTFPMQHTNPEIDEWAKARYGVTVDMPSGTGGSYDFSESFENRLIPASEGHPEAVIRKTGERFFIYDMDGKELPIIAESK